MYSFFDLGGTASVRIAAGVAATIITVLVMAPLSLGAIVSASPSTPFLYGALA